MTSSLTNGSLHLQRMDSSNRTAANAGLHVVKHNSDSSSSDDQSEETSSESQGHEYTTEAEDTSREATISPTGSHTTSINEQASNSTSTGDNRSIDVHRRSGTLQSRKEVAANQRGRAATVQNSKISQRERTGRPNVRLEQYSSSQNAEDIVPNIDGQKHNEMNPLYASINFSEPSNGNGISHIEPESVNGSAKTGRGGDVNCMAMSEVRVDSLQNKRGKVVGRTLPYQPPHEQPLSHLQVNDGIQQGGQINLHTRRYQQGGSHPQQQVNKLSHETGGQAGPETQQMNGIQMGRRRVNKIQFMSGRKNHSLNSSYSSNSRYRLNRSSNRTGAELFGPAGSDTRLSDDRYNGNANDNVNGNAIGSMRDSVRGGPQTSLQPKPVPSVHPSTILDGPFEVSASAPVAGYRGSQSPFRDESSSNLKQINNQRRPMYTPAVLRSTTTLTDLDVSPPDGISRLPERPRMRSTSSASSITSLNSISSYWNYIRGAGGWGSSQSDREIDFGPTRRHWKPNSSRYSCYNCGRLLNYLTSVRRKHHCRYCGEIFCSDCLRNYIYLDRDAHFAVFGSGNDQNEAGRDGSNHNEEAEEGEGKKDSNNSHSEAKKDNKKYLCKVCASCAQKYENFVKEHSTRDHNLGSAGDELSGRRGTGRRETLKSNQSGVPIDWDWSSF